MAVNPLFPIQAVQGDFDRLTLALGKFRAGLIDAAAKAAEATLPPGFIDVRQLRETLEIIDLEAGRAEERLKGAMREAALGPRRFLPATVTGPVSLKRWAAGFYRG